MKSPFWSYFADTLRFSLIDRPGPLQVLAKGLALRLDTVREDAVFLRAQWFPQLCEPELVAAYGASRGITRHHTESAEQFRARVVGAYAWHLLGGKQEGLPQILKFYGFDIAGIENLRRYQPSRWAEFQVGLDNLDWWATPPIPPGGQDGQSPSMPAPVSLADQNAIQDANGLVPLRTGGAPGGTAPRPGKDGLETLVWLINEYKPARSVLARLYTDIYNVTPLVWSEGKWSDHFYSLFSGVPASDLGPGFQGEGDLIVSFGLRYGVEAARPDGAWGVPVFAGLSRTGFIAPYIDAPKWSEFRWSQDFPHKHGFTVGELFSTDWAERITRSGPWEGAWDARKWAEMSVWDRPLPQWEMHSRGISRSGLVYRDPFLEGDGPSEERGPALPDAGLGGMGGTAPRPSFAAGRLGGLNACWSVPTVIQVGRPNRWGAFRYSDSTQRRVVTIHRQSASRRAFHAARPAFASGGGSVARGVSGAQTAPLHDETWSGAWNARRWNNYIAYFGITSIEER